MTRVLTPAQRCQLAENLVPLAAQFAAIVHDDSPDEITRLLWALPPQHLPAFCVVLAAMVDVTKTPEQLLSWVTWQWGPL